MKGRAHNGGKGIISTPASIVGRAWGDVHKKLRHMVAAVKGKATRRAIIRLMPYVIAAYLGDRMSWLYRHTRGDSFHKAVVMMSKPGLAFRTWLPSIETRDMAIGIITSIILYAAVEYRLRHKKNYRHGEEYGSARWGNEKDIEPFIDPVFRNNIPLTATERLMCSFPSGISGTFARPSKPKYGRNKNIMVVGGSGSGKTRFFVKPSIMQMNCSLIVTDSKGTLVLETGRMLERGAPMFDGNGKPVMDKNGRQKCRPYRIKIFNTIDFHKSNHYNPFAYLKTEKDILKLVTVLMENTKGDGKGGDPFWEKAERLLLSAYIGYMHYFCTNEEKTFATLIDMLDQSEVREDDENAVNAVDLLFKEAEEQDSRNFAVRQYKKYKLAAGDISCRGNIHHFTLFCR